MGRTSKFTFPVPGRKQKVAPSQPANISGPLTKAEKILGTGELSIDSPAAAKDRPRIWDARSSSGISITISESTASFKDNAGLGRLDEGEVVNGVSGRHARWEDESAIIPRDRNGPGSRGNTATGGVGNDATTDASSLRRQRSSSTINTYYDKSKVPLSISQQTASSAMAKGLPAKASALLDMDGSHNPPPKPRQKKPSKLDISYLLPKSMSAKRLPPPDTAQVNHVLGADMTTRSPSVMSVSPDIAPPSVQQWADRKPRKKLTLETLRDHWLEPNNKPVPALGRKMRTTASAAELHNIYDHYEQRSFHGMAGTSPAIASPEGDGPRGASSYASTSGGRGFLSPYSSSASRTTLVSRDRSNSHRSEIDTPTMSLMTPSSLKSRPTDSASVSSRHTRTSKASKRTDHSLTDLDLRQNSVLSLSSDSEEEYGDRPNTSVSGPRRPSDEQSSPTSSILYSFPRPVSPQVTDANSANVPLGRAGPMPSSYSQFSPRESCLMSTRVSPPKIAERTSSLFASSAGLQKANAVHSISRLSLSSTNTARSTTPGPVIKSSQVDSTGKEARAIALIPAHGFRYRNGSRKPSAHRRVSELSNASDQPTPPLSPSSMDFYIQSQHSSMAFDRSSIRSGQSTGATSGATIRNSTDSNVGGGDGSGRLIAVTRQEEMLLAALRIKRARMRDRTLAGYEEDQDGAIDAEATPLHHPRPQHRYDQPSQPLPDPPTKQRSSSESKRSSSRQISRNSSLSTVRLASLPEQPYGEQHQQLRPPPSASSAPTLGGKRGGSVKDSHGQERVLLYMDNHDSRMDAVDLAESSHEFDDFMDFDYLGGDGTSKGTISDTGSGSGSGSGSGQPPSGRSANPLQEAMLFPATPTGRNKSRANGLPKLDLVASRPQRHNADDVHVRIMEDGPEASSGAADENDIPRPDSPISPVADLPLPTSQLPKKKQVRLSAVGYRPTEAGLWGDDG